MPPRDVEVLVVGGGPAGAATALSLARAGRSVLLVHRPSAVPHQVGESLPPAASTLLEELGVLDALADDGHQPSYGVQSVWGSPVPRVTDFIRDPAGPGWRLDRPRFDWRLRQAAAEAGAAVVEGEGASPVERGPDGWGVSVGEQRVAARWAVDATGRASAMGRRQGGRRVQLDRLVGCVALFAQAPDGALDTDSTTLVEAVADGWWYTARLPDGRRVAVFHTDADLPAARLGATLVGYQALLAETAQLRARLTGQGYRPVLGPYLTAAHSARLIPPLGPAWLAVGDAAVSFDPLSSQGLLTALYLGVQAGAALATHLDGVASTLNSYAAQVDAVYTVYEQRRLEYYGYEQRWAERPFWRRRLLQPSVEPGNVLGQRARG